MRVISYYGGLYGFILAVKDFHCLLVSTGDYTTWFDGDYHNPLGMPHQPSSVKDGIVVLLMTHLGLKI